MKAVVLTYHSHHVVGTDYDLNDHVALSIDLGLITAAGYQIVSLDTIVDVLEGYQANKGDDGIANTKLIGLTFDDGPLFDVEDFVHPEFGPQQSFLRIMREYAATPAGKTQPHLQATSFVIASPEARRIIESTFDAEYTFLTPGSLADDWWARAATSGFLNVANHSWDHLHPALPTVAHSRQVRADFTQVTTRVDADAQIMCASRFIAERTGGKAAPFFAFPFGHHNDFLTRQYLPMTRQETGIRAAFTAEPKPITGDESQWCLPRYVCGHHWRSARELLSILAP